MILDRIYSSSLIILNSDTSDRSSFSHDSNSGKEYFCLNKEDASSEMDKLDNETDEVKNIYTDSIGSGKSLLTEFINFLIYILNFIELLNENLYSSDTTSATNSPNFNNVILYKQLLRGTGLENKNSVIMTSLNINSINENSRHLKCLHDDNTSSIFGYDALSIQRDICPFEISTQNNNRRNDDSISNLSERKKRIIVRVVTIFSIILFIICVGMIAITLRMSEKIDEKSKNLKSQNNNSSNY